ncbi:MAG: GntR family transcriptional regulator [Cryobacterium sp.]|nr:GntR family transcriptional regulator [Cryobacterium sp.]
MDAWSVLNSTERESLEQRTSRRLRELVADVLQPGEQLPAEPELALRLGVSRATLRVAMTELIADRLIVRHRGVGTFVADTPQRLAHGLDRLVGTGETIRQRGRIPGATNLEVRHTVIAPKLAADSPLEAGTEVLHISRVRTADGTPVMQAEEWVPTAVLPQPDALDDFSESDSLYERLRAAGVSIRVAITRFEPVVPGPAVRRQLGTASGRALLLLETEHFSDEDAENLVLFTQNIYDPAQLSLHVVRR